MAQVQILNCNNISEALLTIEPEKLNIIFGANGTGKSTMAKVIAESQRDNPDLTPYTPYNQASSGQPAVNGCHFRKVVLFNDDYIHQYVYQKDTLIKDAFEIFVRTPAFDAAQQLVDDKLAELRTVFAEDRQIQALRTNITALLGHIKLTKNNTLAKTGSGIKSILAGKGDIFDPPEQLRPMLPFITDSNVVGWASWRIQGQAEYGAKGLCPFCATRDNDSTQAVSNAFEAAFDKSSVSLASGLKTVLEELKEFIATDKAEEILALFGKKDRVDALQTRLEKLGIEASGINEKLNRLVGFNALQVDRSNLQALDKMLNSMRIDPDAYNDFFCGPAMQEIIARVNSHVNVLIQHVNELRGAFGRYQATITKTIQDRQEDINDFLQSAGFRYRFMIHTEADTQARAVLQYIMPDGRSSDTPAPSTNLSWGERHAIAMILFMFDAIRQDADLIILDDPISSFDSNKKYALMHRLFLTRHKEKSLYQRTVLLLTHDFQPIIDYVWVGGRIMDSTSVVASFCRNHQGTLVLQPINKHSDIGSTVMLMGEMARDTELDVAVRVGSLRKYIEHTERNFQNNPAYNVISSLIHGRAIPTNDNAGSVPMTPEAITQGEAFIQIFIPDFDYSYMLASCQPAALLSRYRENPNSYNKIMLLRMYCEQEPSVRQRLAKENDVLLKYIDESFHIENDYVYMLDVRKFDIVPTHIIIQADQFIASELQTRQAN